jgi:hypothetical protein
MGQPQRRSGVPTNGPRHPVTQTLSEADMWHTTITGHHRDHHTVAAAFWIVAGVIAVIALGDAFMLLAVALAIVTIARWVYREATHRVVERNDTGMAPVTHLRSALTDQRDLKNTSAHASWRGPSAA